MRPIPKRMRIEMAQDPFYHVCCLAGVYTGSMDYCSGRVTWHHCFTHAGKQINEKWAIVPACEYHHDHKRKDFLDQLKKVALSRTIPGDLEKYPKKDWDAEKRKLGFS